MASRKVIGKKQQLLSMKYNQRSQLQFHFTEKGKCGPKGKLWESFSKKERDEIQENYPDYVLEDPCGEHHLYWVMPPTNILVIKKFKDMSVTRKFKELTKWLVEEKQLTVIVEPSIFLESEIKDDHAYVNTKDSFTTWDIDIRDHQSNVLDTVDLIICVGGDGTLLYTSSMFQENFPPIMSFHMGSLGFLTPFQFAGPPKDKEGAEPQEEKLYKKHVERVLKGGMSLTLRQRLECKIKTEAVVSTVGDDVCMVSPGDKKSFFDVKDKLPWKTEEHPNEQMLVMNDLVVDRGPNPYLTNLTIKCNGRMMTNVQGDGIIIASPTGSTAYSLAAGASMVHPSVPCMVVTPICPHSLSFRSIVVPSGVELEIALSPSSRNSAWVSFDGRNRQEIAKGNSVVVSTCKWPVPSMNNTGHVTDWFDSLAECLNWNVRKEQKKLDS